MNAEVRRGPLLRIVVGHASRLKHGTALDTEATNPTLPRRFRHLIEPGHSDWSSRLQTVTPTLPTRSPIDATTSGHISRPDLSNFVTHACRLS